MTDISIIIPVYNAEKYINKTLNSISNQVFNGQYQIIIIDDGSTDSTGDLCNRYSKKNKNIVYKRIKNSGVSTARNIGLSIANSKYVSFLDSDDTVSYNYLQSLYDAFSEDIDLVIGSYKRINENSNKEIEKVLPNNKYFKNEFQDIIPKLQNNNLFNQVWNKMFKLSIIRENNIKFPINITYGEDFRFVLEYFNYIKCIQVIDTIVYNYINRTNGLNLKYRDDRIYINLENVFELENYFYNCSISKNFSKYIKKKSFNTLLSGLCSLYNNPNKKSIKIEQNKFLNNNSMISKLKKYDDLKINMLLTFAKYGGFMFRIFVNFMNHLKKAYKAIKLGY